MGDKCVLSDMTGKLIRMTVTVGCLTLCACSGGGSGSTDTKTVPTVSATSSTVGSTVIDDPLTGYLAHPATLDVTDSAPEVFDPLSRSVKYHLLNLRMWGV